MSDKNKIQVGFHVGRVVQYLASTYGRWDQVVGELVQNILDARATSTNVGAGCEATIYLDFQTRTLMAWDNGMGATLAEMRTRIENIGAPIKEKMAKKRGPQIGRRGIGNLAPIAIKGEHSKWTFESHKVSGPANRWYRLELNMEGLDDQKEVGFVSTDLPGFKPVDERGSILIGVQTKVCMTDIEASALAPLLKVDNPATMIAQSISETFSSVLLKTKARIHVRILDPDGYVRSDVVKPQAYKGDKKVVTIDGVEFEFYVTRANQKQAKIVIEHEGQVSFPISDQKELWDQVKPVLGCGHFQGMIRTKLGQLVPNRTRLAYSKDYDKFCDAVIKFTTEYAEGWMNEILEEGRDDRIAKVMENVLDKLAPLVLQNPALAEIFKASKNPVGRPSKEDEEEGIIHHAVSTGGGAGSGGGKKRHTPSEEKTPSAPKVIHGGKVTRHACGLSIKIIEASPTSDRGINWRAMIGDTGLEKGLLLVNKSHQDWRTAEGVGESALETYTLLVSIATFTSAMSRNHDRGLIFQQEFEEHFLPLHKPLVPRIPSYGKSRLLRAKEKKLGKIEQQLSLDM